MFWQTFVKPFLRKFTILNVLCLLILLTSIQKLNLKSTKIYFQNRHQDESGIKLISICLGIKHYDCSDLVDKFADSCRRLNEVTDHIQDAYIEKTPGSILEMARFKNLSNLFKFKPSFAPLEYYLLFNHLCINYNNSEPERSFIFFVNTYGLSVTIFLHDEPLKTSYKEVLFEYECKNFVGCPSGYYVSQSNLQFLYLEEPYITRCANLQDKQFSFQKFESIRSPDDCLNECLKSRLRLSRLFYSSNDTEPFKFEPNEPLTLPKDETLIERCSKSCEQVNCLTNKYNKNVLVPNYLKNRLIIEKEMPIYVETLPLFPRFCFWLHILTLLGCIFGISLVEVLDEFVNSFLRGLFKLAEDSRTIRILNMFKWAVLFVFSLVASSLLINLLVKNHFQYDYEEDTVNETKFKLSLCMPLFKSYKDSRFLDKFELNTEEHQQFGDMIEQKTLEHLNENSFGLEHFLTNLDRLPMNVTGLFYHFRSKCFETEIDFGDNDTMQLNFTTYPFYAYLTWHNQTFNNRVAQIGTEVKLMLSFRTRFYGCRNYDSRSYNTHNHNTHDHGQIDQNSAKFNCSSRRSCIEKCYLYRFVDKHKRLPFMNLFEEDFDKFKHLYFRNQYDRELLSECSKRFNVPDCLEISSLRYMKNVPIQIDNFRVLLLDRPREMDNEIHFESNYLVDISIELFNLYSCIGILSLAISSLKRQPLSACVRFLVRLGCALCFFVHVYLIMISSRQVALSRFFTFEELERYGLDGQDGVPTIHICVDLEDDSIRKFFDLKVTNVESGIDLEEQTRQIHIERLVDRIQYLNENYELAVERNLSKLQTTDKTIELSTFFFATKKCFGIKTTVDPKDTRFFLIKELLSFKFKPELNDLHYELLILHPANSFEPMDDRAQFKFAHTYEVKFIILYELKYNFFDQIHYASLDALKDEFKNKFNSSTLRLPLTKEYFDLKINDTLFKSFLKNQTSLDRFSHVDVKANSVEIESKDYNLIFDRSAFKYYRQTEGKKNFEAIFIEVFGCASLWLEFSFQRMTSWIVNKFKKIFGRKSKNRVEPS